MAPLDDCSGVARISAPGWEAISLSKTEVLLVGLRQQLKKVSPSGVMVGDSLIAPVTSVRDLGAVFDTNITMVPQSEYRMSVGAVPD